MRPSGEEHHRWSRPLPLAVLCGWLALLAVPIAATAQQRSASERAGRPLITVITPRVSVPVVRSDVVEVRTPVRVRRGVPPSRVVVQLLDAVPEPDRPEAPVGAIVLLPDDGSGPGARPLDRNGAIGVGFDTTEVLPGTYILKLEARVRGRPRESRANAEVMVRIPPPALRPTAPLHVERVIGPLESDRIQPLTVRETSARSRALVNSVGQTNETSEGGVVAGDLAFPLGGKATIAPGGVMRIRPAATKGFPMGTTSGTIEVESQQLDTPVSVGFVVETRLSRFYLAVALGLGLLAGLLARVILRRRIEDGEGQLMVDALRSRVQRERARRLDPLFVQKTEAILDAIDDASDTSGKSDDLRQVCGKQQLALDEAIADFEQRRTELKPELEQRAAALTVSRSLPGAIRRELTGVSHSLGLAAERFSANDLTSARQRLDDANQRFEQVLVVAQDFRSDLKHFADAVTGAVDLLGEVAALGGEVSALADAEPPRDNWNVALESIARTHAAANALRDRVGRAARATYIEMAAAATPAEAHGWPRRSRSSADGATTLIGLEHAIAELDAALEAATGTALPAYQRAAEALIAAERAKGAADGTVAATNGSRGNADRAAFVTMAARTASAAGVASAAHDTGASGWTAPVLFAAAAPRGVVHEHRVSRKQISKELRRARQLQQLILATVVFIVGYELFEGEFVGTVEQLVLAFLWAFTANVSLGAVTTVAQERRDSLQAPTPATS